MSNNKITKVNVVEGIPDLVLHILDHAADVGDVGSHFTYCRILLRLQIDFYGNEWIAHNGKWLLLAYTQTH